MISPLVENQAWKISAQKNHSLKSWRNFLKKKMWKENVCVARGSNAGWSDVVEEQAVLNK